MSVKLSVDINLDGKDNTKRAFASAKASASDLTSTITALSTAYLAVVDIAGRVARAMQAPIQEALNYEREMLALSTSLKAVNLFSERNVKSISAFGSEMQAAAGLAGGLVQTLTAQNVTMLKSVENAEALTEASIALSKARGIDLEAANQLLIRSLSGEAGQLKRLIPEINSMTEAQLRSGEAVRLVSGRFREFISADFDTAGGKITRLGLAYEDLQESIGVSTLKGFQATGAFENLAKALGLMQKNVEGQGSAWEFLGKAMGDSVNWMIDFFDKLNARVKLTLGYLGKFALFFDSEAGKHYQQIIDSAEGALRAPFYPTPDGKLPSMQKAAGSAARRFEDPNFEATARSAEAEIKMRRQLADQIFALENETTDELILERESRLRKILELEEDAARESIDISREAAKLRELTQASYSRKESERLIDKATAFVGAVQGGLNSIIGQIGQQFGAEGRLIAGIIQIFNQSEEQFAAMVDQLIEAIINLPEYLVRNLSILIEKIPELTAALYSQLYSVEFWSGAVQSLWTALVNMFKNFWALLFGGDLTSSVQKARNRGGALATFGSDDPNAGEGEFKIKDANLRAQRRVTQSFEDSFEETVDQGGKSFIQYLREAFDNVVKMLGDFFTNVWRGFLDVFKTIGGWFESWISKIGDGFKAAWDGLLKFFEAVGSSFKSLFKVDVGSFAQEIGNAIKGVLNPIVGAVKTVLNGIIDFLNAIYLPGVNVGFDVLGKKVSFGWGDIDLVPGNIARLREGGMIMQGMVNRDAAAAFAAMGAMRFNKGGTVPGTGFSDTVPALLTPGERVLSRREVSAMVAQGSQAPVVNLTFNVAAGAVFDRDAVRQAMPQIIEHIRRESRNGTIIVTPNGIGR
jgi:hypothetical protein